MSVMLVFDVNTNVPQVLYPAITDGAFILFSGHKEGGVAQRNVYGCVFEIFDNLTILPPVKAGTTSFADAA